MRFILFICFLLICSGCQTQSQVVVLGKNPSDQILPRFWDQNGNRTNVTAGLFGAPTAGALLVGKADGTFGLLTMGTNGQALVVDSAAPNKVKWADVSSGSAGTNTATNAFTVTTNTLAFDTWKTNGTRRAILNVSIKLYAFDGNPARMTLRVEDAAGAWTHEDRADAGENLANAARRMWSVPLSPGARWKVENTEDSQTQNAIIGIRISEF